MMRYIEGVQKVNPSNAPFVVGALLDQERWRISCRT